MNPFTTEHPLEAQTSWFDTREHPVLSFVCRSVVLALLFTPLVLYGLHLVAIDDIGAEPLPLPDPWRVLFWGCLIAFVLSLLAAVPVLIAFRFLARWGRR
jgi:hypothetical protein